MGNKLKFISVGVILVICCFNANADSKVDRAIELYKKWQVRDAKQLLLSLEKQQPENDKILYYLGKIAFLESQHKQALEYFDRALAIKSDESDYYYSAASTLSVVLNKSDGSMGNVKNVLKIIKQLKSAIEFNPGNHESRLMLMLLYHTLPEMIGGSKVKARKQAEELRKINEFRGEIAEGLLFEQDGLLEKAEASFLRAVGKAPDNWEVYYTAARFYRRIKKYDKGLEMLKKAVKLVPDNLMVLYLTGKLASIANSHLDWGEQSLAKFLEQCSASPHAHYTLGKIYVHKGKIEKAKSCFSRALELKPDYSEARSELNALQSKKSNEGPAVAEK